MVNQISDHDLLIRIDERTGEIKKDLAAVCKRIEEVESENDILNTRMDRTESKQKDNRTLIGVIWGFVVLLAGALFSLFFGHLRGG